MCPFITLIFVLLCQLCSKKPFEVVYGCCKVFIIDTPTFYFVIKSSIDDPYKILIYFKSLTSLWMVLFIFSVDYVIR